MEILGTESEAMSDCAHLWEPEQDPRIEAARAETAAGLNESLVRLVSQAGLAATHALTCSTDEHVQQQLAFTVETLDEALAEVRSAIFKAASGDVDLSPFVSARHEQVGALHRMILDGELDVASAVDVEDRLVEMAGTATVEVDLARLRFIDARGMAALLSAKRRIAEDGKYLRIVGAHGMVRRVFTLVDLDGILDDD